MRPSQHEKLRKKKAAKLATKPAGKLKPVDMHANDHPEWMTRAFSNNRYVVMIGDNMKMDLAGKEIPAIKAMVQRHDNSPIKNHWAEMQSIKNELFGTDTTAIEYYPPESQLIDDFNIYWLWVIPQEYLPSYSPY